MSDGKLAHQSRMYFSCQQERMLRQCANVPCFLCAGETLRLQFPKEDLGFVYGSGALLLEDTSMSCDAGSSVRDAPYVPSSAPGMLSQHMRTGKP